MIEMTFLKELILIRQVHPFIITNYRCIISGISKSEALNLMQNIDLTEKCGTW